MSKIHETIKNVKKSPKKSAKEKRLEKREKKTMRNKPIDIRKVFEEKDR